MLHDHSSWRRGREKANPLPGPHTYIPHSYRPNVDNATRGRLRMDTGLHVIEGLGSKQPYKVTQKCNIVHKKCLKSPWKFIHCTITNQGPIITNQGRIITNQGRSA